MTAVDPAEFVARGTCGRTLEIRALLLDDVAGEPPTPVVRVDAIGTRAGELAHAVYLSHDAEDLQRFAAGARRVSDRDAWLAAIGYPQGTLRAEREPGRREGWLRLKFRGERGRVAWTDLYPPNDTLQLLSALDTAAAHLTGSVP